MTLRQLHAVMLRLAHKFRLRASYNFYRGRRAAQIESVAHELAHGVDLAGRPLSSRKVDRAVEDLRDRAADQHELRVQRIEALALRTLGMRVSVRYLALTSRWRRDGWVPSDELVDAPLTKREQRGVALFLAVVLREAGAA